MWRRDRRTRVCRVLRRIAEIEDPYAIDKSDPVKYFRPVFAPGMDLQELLSVLDREKAEEVLGATIRHLPLRSW